MKTKTQTVYGTLYSAGREYLCLSQSPIVLLGDDNLPMNRETHDAYLAVGCGADYRNDGQPVHDEPFVVLVPKNNYVLEYEKPHTIYCVDSEEVEEEPLDLGAVWSAEDILAREG